MSGVAHLSTVPRVVAWSIYGTGCEMLPLYSSPAEALARFVTDPMQWPESVDFWMRLMDGGAARSECLGRVHEGMKRPDFNTLLQVRHLRTHLAGADDALPWSYTHIDFWFFGKLLEVMNDMGIGFMSIDDDGHEHSLACALPYFDELDPYLTLRRKSDWRTNFLLIRDQRVLLWLGVEYGRSESGFLKNMRARRA